MIRKYGRVSRLKTNQDLNKFITTTLTERTVSKVRKAMKKSKINEDILDLEYITANRSTLKEDFLAYEGYLSDLTSEDVINLEEYLEIRSKTLTQIIYLSNILFMSLTFLTCLCILVFGLKTGMTYTFLGLSVLNICVMHSLHKYDDRVKTLLVLTYIYGED